MPTQTLHNKQLVLFMTRGLSLNVWGRIGSFDREVALYQAMQPHWGKISIVSYGDRTDLKYADKIPGIQILCNRWRLPFRIYSLLIPLLHYSTLKNASMLKTNQTSGGEAVLACAKFLHKPFVARSGFVLSDFVKRDPGHDYTLAEACRLEETLFTKANKIVVSTSEAQKMIIDSYHIPASKIEIFPNFVRTDIFCPKPDLRQARTVIFVGRLKGIKNLLNLFEAFSGLDYKLVIIGNGPLYPELKERAEQLSLNVEFIKNVDNQDLPVYLNKSSLFVLPSILEGHPKTLIEAMSCGLPVIGADSPGIREIIQHNENGYLCGTDPQSIRQAVVKLMNDAELQKRLGENARKYVLDNFAFEKIVEMELRMYRSIL
jgi:glycosyltransferase involved in cell wall biosynthesis